MLDPQGWTSVGYAVFWALLAFVGPRVFGVKKLFNHRFNPFGWIDEMCVVLAIVALAHDTNVAVLAWLRDNVAYTVPGFFYNVGAFIIDQLAALFGLG